ncbi:hypothetical protein Psed_5809 [Pseudonocardia dioxanivorans CB1190]|uniref:Uncharacterized protein n=1 Tax=Pseudonocardia dioxanivorans (strain ATCC 55486 / DSM 44775 / JCM 13855 / CB1190) TaxID=675635 RepID=F4D1E6_PSEUX|nr:hypothetical protein Psed_5809 [Pseudonocardia dioxanivorans CB1190]
MSVGAWLLCGAAALALSGLIALLIARFIETGQR